MELVALAAIIGVLYLVSRGGVTASATGPGGGTTVLSVGPQNPYGISPFAGGTNPGLTGGGLNLGATVQQSTTQLGNVINQAGQSPDASSGLAAAAPIVGAAVAVVGAIFNSLWQAHTLRAKQATSENQAMNAGVQGYDQAVKYINGIYNTGQADPNSCIQALQRVLANYWAEVTPVIQPGRNGCNGGQQCSGLTCGGDVGAACCVGCGNLAGTPNPIPFAGQVTGNVHWGILGTIAVIQQGGGPVYYPTVFGSKYGGQQRNGYWLTWKIQA